MPSAGNILFVNKTVRSGKLSQSKGLEKSKIFSHVQRSAYNRVPEAAAASAVLYQTPEDWLIHQASEPSDTAPTIKLPNRSKQPQNRARWESTRKPSPVALASPKSSQSLPLDRFVSPHGDPFNSLAVSTSPYMENLLRFYSSDVVPKVFPIKSLAVVSREYTLAFAYQDSLLRDTLLCTTSAAMCCATGDSKHGVAAISFKVSALKTLQTTLSKPTDSEAKMSSLYAVSLLLWIECLNGNTTDLRAHSAGLKQLVSRAGDIRDTPLCILATVLACSYLCSALLDVPPNLAPVAICEDEKLSGAARSILRTLDVPGTQGPAPRLFTTSTMQLMGPQLTSLAIDQQEVMALRDWCVGNELESTIADVEYLYTKETSLEHQLLQLPFDVALSSAQEAIRLVLFIFPQPIILVARPTAAFCRKMSTRLRTSLERSGLSDLWAPNCEMLIWLLFVGAYISDNESERPWFQSQLSTLFSFLGLQSASEVEDILNGFYYYPRFFGDTLEKIWETYDQKSIHT